MRLKGTAALLIAFAVAPMAEPVAQPPVRERSAAASALTGYRHVPGEVTGGVYRTPPIRVGRWTMDTLSIGDLANFRAFERQPTRAPAPIVLNFADTTSRVRSDDGYSSRYTVQRRVRLSAYYGGNPRFAFRGRVAGMGEVSFEGRFLQRHPETVQGVVLVGSLRVGGRAFRNVEFSYEGG